MTEFILNTVIPSYCSDCISGRLPRTLKDCNVPSPEEITILRPSSEFKSKVNKSKIKIDMKQMLIINCY